MQPSSYLRWLGMGLGGGATAVEKLRKTLSRNVSNMTCHTQAQGWLFLNTRLETHPEK